MTDPSELKRRNKNLREYIRKNIKAPTQRLQRVLTRALDENIELKQDLKALQGVVRSLRKKLESIHRIAGLPMSDDVTSPYEEVTGGLVEEVSGISGGADVDDMITNLDTPCVGAEGDDLVADSLKGIFDPGDLETAPVTTEDRAE